MNADGAGVVVRAPEQTPRRGSSGRFAAGVVVAALAIAGALVLMWRVGVGGFLEPPPAPIQELAFERVTLRPGTITMSVRNAGPDPIDIAQVLVDDAYWQFRVAPDAHLGRLERATVTLDYPWVAGEPLAITVLDATGTTFGHEIAAAGATPQVGGRTVLGYVLLGTYAGLIPVLLGLLLLPVLQRLGERGLSGLIGVTAGMLVFLALDALVESLELAGELPSAFQGVALTVGAAALSLMALAGVGRWMRTRRGRVHADGTAWSPLGVAYLVALGIGLHNLGEGLAIGSAHALGEIALGTFLVIGFALHNLTEGIGIVAPTVRTPPPVHHLLALGALAGLPTIAGTLVGGFAFSAVVAVLFLAVGIGAILQVVYELAGLIRRGSGRMAETPALLGVAVGFVVMYATGLLVKS